MVLVEGPIRDAEARFGTPVDLVLEVDLDPGEIELVSGSLRKSRVHDVTLLILDRRPERRGVKEYATGATKVS